jgi:hypothetical protein
VIGTATAAAAAASRAARSCRSRMNSRAAPESIGDCLREAPGMILGPLGVESFSP